MVLSELSDGLSDAPSSATFPVRLHSITYGAEDVRLFEFRSLGTSLPTGEPGSHIDVYLPEKRIRQYSLITPLSTPESYVIAVKREVSGRGGSLYLHDRMRVGETAIVSSPRNLFPLNEAADEFMLLAGGIGITPIYSMFARLRTLDRKVRLHYWCRSKEAALFAEILSADPDFVHLHLPGNGRPSPADIVRRASPSAHIYCCGPSRMMSVCSNAVSDPTRFHSESFGGGAGKPDVKNSEALSVHLARKNIEIEVAAGQTILEALIAANIDVPYSCEEGICGACEAKILAGTPDHRDRVRSAAENDKRQVMMICCSRSCGSRLILDI